MHYQVIDSFYENTPGKGLPLGNITSHIYANLYLNPFDQWIKRRCKHVVRFCDDWVILSDNKKELLDLIVPIETFLKQTLNLIVHPQNPVCQTFLWHRLFRLRATALP